MTRKRYRIRIVEYATRTEHWVDKSIRLFGIHLFWTTTTISYFTHMDSAEQYFKDLTSPYKTTIL